MGDKIAVEMVENGKPARWVDSKFWRSVLCLGLAAGVVSFSDAVGGTVAEQPWWARVLTLAAAAFMAWHGWRNLRVLERESGNG